MGDIQLSEDPYDDLPPEIVIVLERLFHTASDAHEDDRLARLLSAARAAIIDDDNDDVGMLVANLIDDTDPQTAEIGRLLDRYVDALADEEERTRRWAALWDLLADWVELHGDQEKLFGHLSLKHGGPPSVSASYDELVELHVGAHQSSSHAKP